MQDHTTGDMIFDVPTLIESLSSTMTLRPGAVILTGTPQGVGFARNPPVWMKDGDMVVVEIEEDRGGWRTRFGRDDTIKGTHDPAAPLGHAGPFQGGFTSAGAVRIPGMRDAPPLPA